MKSHNFQWFMFFTLYILIRDIRSKSFLEAAKDKVQEEFKYDSEEYRNEPASLNHEYYTKRGKEELDQCRNTFKANYDDCRNYKTCNFCSANSGCGWCDEKKICIPLDLNSRKDELVPICMGDCIKVLKIEYCYKVLFEPDNTQDEVNFANMDQVINQEKYAKTPYDTIDLDNEDDISFENIMQKTLEKNIIESQKIKPEFNYNLIQKNENEIGLKIQNQKKQEISSENLAVLRSVQGMSQLNNMNSNMNRINSIHDFNQIIHDNNQIEKELVRNSEQNKTNQLNKGNFLEKAMNIVENESNTKTEKLETESLENALSNNFKENSFSNSLNDDYFEEIKKNSIEKMTPDCDEVKNGIHGVSKINPVVNDPSMNFIPKSYTNYDNIDLEKHSQKLYQEMAQISKDVFNSLLAKDLKSRKKTNFIKANLDDGSKTDDEFLKYLKEFIPNFEFPQFVKSDLEQSINDIKREKLLLWLRGFSLNDEISKIHLPIYKNLSFTNEDQIRKMFLDRFYKEIVKDPNGDINSVMYKNMIGNSGVIIPNNDFGKYAGKKPIEIVKSMKVIDPTFIDKKDLVGLVKQSNMRFKETLHNNRNQIESKKNIGIKKNENKRKSDNLKNKSLKDLSNQLKIFMKKLK